MMDVMMVLIMHCDDTKEGLSLTSVNRTPEIQTFVFNHTQCSTTTSVQL